MIRRARTWLALLAWASGAALAGPPPAELFFRAPDIGQAELSPSGRRLAITAPEADKRMGLVIIDMGPERKITRIAQFDHGDVQDVRWVNEDRLIFGVGDTSQGSGRIDAMPGLYGIDADGKALQQFVRRFGWAYTTMEDRVAEVLPWNHVVLQVPKPKPDQINEEVLLAKYSIREPFRLEPKWLNVRTGRTRELDLKVPRAASGWLTDEDGEPRVAIVTEKNLSSAWWRAPGSSAWLPLYESTVDHEPFRPHSVDSEGRLYVTRTEGPQATTVLARYDFSKKAPETTSLVVTRGFDFEGQWVTDDERRTLGVRVLMDGETTFWFNDAMKALQQQADTLLPGRINRIDCRRCAQPDMVALVWSMSDRDPGKLWFYKAKPQDGEQMWTSLGRIRSGIDPESMATLDLHRITARDGREVPVWVTRPPGRKGPLPTVVLVHGGPWQRGVIWHWSAMTQYLASRGYLVIEPEFRGSTGYGMAHVNAGRKAWGQAMQDDVTDALRWAQSKGLASDKACIVGASYGGYSALMGLARDPDLYRCGIAWNAVTDLDLLVRGSRWVIDDITDAGRQYVSPEWVGDPEQDATMIQAQSPVKLAARIKAPVMLAVGEDDVRVPIAHGKRMRDALRAAGHAPEWVVYAGEGHQFTALKNKVDLAQRIDTFLARHLQPPSGNSGGRTPETAH